MTVPPDDATAAARTAVDAVTAAYDHAARLVEALTNSDVAFDLATELWRRLRAATDTNGALRARIADRTRREHELDLSKLAERLSRPDHPINRSRAHQLVQAARAARNAARGEENAG